MSHYCPACNKSVPQFRPGGRNRRPNARCPECGSLERHRFLAVLLENLAPMIVGARALVDVAPMPQVEHLLRTLGGDRYLSIDLDPAADGRTVMARADLTALPFSDDSVDFLLCCHVLEHVPDDHAAMRELRRVLSGRGFAIVQVPWNGSGLTDEDPSAPEEVRIARFGQADHVRLYGRDLDDRLSAAGLRTLRVAPGDVLSPEGVARFGLRTGPIWIVQPAGAARAGAPDPRHAAGTLRLRTVDDLVGAASEAAALRSDDERLQREMAGQQADTARLRDELRRARTESGRWQRRYEQLAGRWPVRVLRAGKRALRSRNARPTTTT